MRYRWLAPLLLISHAWPQSDADLFNDSVVQELRLTIRQADFDTMRDNYLLNDYYPADLRWLYNGRYLSYPNVAVRSRGYGSRNPYKMNLRIDMNRYVDKQTLVGHNAVALKANNQDASMLKERTVFHLFDRAGLPTPQDVHARVYINERYYGLFAINEEIDKDFLKRTLGENDGDLFSWTPLDQVFHFEWNPVCTDLKPFACSTDPAKWVTRPFSPETNSNTYDINQPINLIRTASTASDADFERLVSPMLDLKLWLFHNALEVFVADFDSILGDVFGANNFYLYRWEKSPLHQFLVWDKDNSYHWAERSIFQNTERNPILRRSLAIPARRTQYLESLYKIAILAGGQGGWMENENRRLYAQIRQGVYDDPNKQTSGRQYAPSTNALFDAKVAENAGFIAERAPWVLREVTANGYQPATSIRVSTGGVVNAASGGAALAPGSLATLYGSGFTAQTVVAAAAPLPTKLAGVSVIVNGFYAPLLFVSPAQINFQIPWELGVEPGTAPFTVTVDGTAIKGTRAGSAVSATFSNMVPAAVKAYAPGVFLATHADGSAITSTAPVNAGGVIVIYATGLGPVDVAQTNGVLAPLTSLVRTRDTPTVTVGNARGEVLFSGLTPGTAGVYQINVRVPTTTANSEAPLVVTIANEPSAIYRLPTQ